MLRSLAIGALGIYSACVFGGSPRQMPPSPLRFLVVGDTQGNDTNPGTADCVPELVRDMLRRNPDFVAFTGDLVATGSVATLSAWNELTAAFGNRRYMVPGNHDLPGRPATNSDWQSLFSWLPESQAVDNVVTPAIGDTIKGIDRMDYYFDPSPGVRVICVTTDRDALPGEQHTYSGGYEIIGGQPRAMDWFQSVMAMPSTKDKRWLFVMTHHPVTSSMSQFGAPEHFRLQAGTPSEWWRSITGQHATLPLAKADALLTGHVHGYYPNHPDPHVHTAEMIVGTGGGRGSGVPHRRRHGFLEIVITGDAATCTFFGDRDGAEGGWSFTDELDTFELTSGSPLAVGLKAHYTFDDPDPLQDAASGGLSKRHELHLRSGARVVAAPGRGGVLELDGGGVVDARKLGDQNLQLLSDLQIELDAKVDGDLGDGDFDNVLVAFGDSEGAKFNGTWLRTRDEEIANYAYVLSYRADGRLQLAWEYHDDPKVGAVSQWEVVTSTVPVAAPEEWHRLAVARSAAERRVAFFVDGERLGEPVAFARLPSGGGTGSLYFGALPNTEAEATGPTATFAGWIDDVSIANRSRLHPMR